MIMKNNTENHLLSNEHDRLVLLYFVIVIAEVIAEFYYNNVLIYILKPLLLPLLGLLYWKSSIKKNNLFIIALFFGFLANIFFISKDRDSVILAVIFFTFYRLIIIYMVIKAIKIKSYITLFLCCLPFLFILLYLSSIVSDEIVNNIYIFCIQVMHMTFLGGFSLANYLHNKNKMSYWLLMSSLLFTIIHFLYTIKFFYLSIFIFQPIVMILYAFAQYFIYKFVLLSEDKEKSYVNELSN